MLFYLIYSTTTVTTTSEQKMKANKVKWKGKRSFKQNKNIYAIHNLKWKKNLHNRNERKICISPLLKRNHTQKYGWTGPAAERKSKTETHAEHSISKQEQVSRRGRETERKMRMKTVWELQNVHWINKHCSVWR